MDIQRTETNSKGAFFVEVDGERQAEMTYSRAGETTLIIDHTEVHDPLRGKGVGKQLVKAAVDYARAHNYRIIPLCPFAKATFDRVEEWRDVLRK